jgi:hypothetical protein
MYDSPNAKIPIRKQPLIEALVVNLKIPRAAAADLDPARGKISAFFAAVVAPGKLTDFEVVAESGGAAYRHPAVPQYA